MAESTTTPNAPLSPGPGAQPSPGGPPGPGAPPAGPNVPPPGGGGPKTPDPVGYIDGNVYDTAVDARVACPGVDLVFKRSYGTWSIRPGALGCGWSHSFEWRLESDGDGRVTLYADADPETSGSGDVHHFAAPSAGGAPVSDAGGYVLGGVSGGARSVTTPGARVYRFDVDGRLAGISSWNGVAIRIERDASGRPRRAVHANGDALSFSYGTDGLLARVSTPDPEVWIEYGYTNLSAAADSPPLLASVLAHGPGGVATNLYVYDVMPPAGRTVYCPPPARLRPVPVSRPGEYVALPDDTGTLTVSNVVDAARPVLARKTDADGLSSYFQYIRADDGPEVKCAAQRSSLCRL